MSGALSVMVLCPSDYKKASLNGIRLVIPELRKCRGGSRMRQREGCLEQGELGECSLRALRAFR